MSYLKDKQYYINLYDEGTVYQCRLTEQSSEKVRKEEVKKKKKLPDGYSADQIAKSARDVLLYFQKGDRYLEKEKTIQEWMERDENKDELYNKDAPLVYCPKCGDRMDLTIKDLESSIKDEDLRVFYLYRCEKCNEKRGVYNNGEPYVFKGDFCPKCNSKWTETSKKSKDKITINSHCDNCGHKESHFYDLTKKPKRKEEIDSNYEKDRARFCLSQKEGEEYRSWKGNLNWLIEHEKDKEAHKEAYKKAQSTKILTVAQLSDLLSKEFTKNNFSGLMISSPEIGRDLIVGFNIQDTKTDRSEFDAKKDLKKILSDLLQDTNWKMMSEGLNYKLGILTGRLRGQDGQDNIYEDLKKEELKPGQVYSKDENIIAL